MQMQIMTAGALWYSSIHPTSNDPYKSHYFSAGPHQVRPATAKVSCALTFTILIVSVALLTLYVCTCSYCARLNLALAMCCFSSTGHLLQQHTNVVGVDILVDAVHLPGSGCASGAAM
jgi:hypothetical protein